MKKNSIVKPCTGKIVSYLLVTLMTLNANVSLAASKMYKQVDPEGNITFTDSPPIDNTQTVEEIQINTRDSGIALDRRDREQEMTGVIENLTKEGEAKAEKKAIKNIKYTLSIVAPKSGQIFGTDTLEIVSGVEITPTLQGGDRLQVLLNNSPVLPPQTDKAFKLPFLPAGEHEIKVQVINAEGGVSAESAPVKIIQMRASSEPAVQ